MVLNYQKELEEYNQAILTYRNEIRKAFGCDISEVKDILKELPKTIRKQNIEKPIFRFGYNFLDTLEEDYFQNSAGVYKFDCTVGCYIGKSIKLKDRLKTHFKNISESTEHKGKYWDFKNNEIDVSILKYIKLEEIQDDIWHHIPNLFNNKENIERYKTYYVNGECTLGKDLFNKYSLSWIAENELCFYESMYIMEQEETFDKPCYNFGVVKNEQPQDIFHKDDELIPLKYKTRYKQLVTKEYIL